MLTYNILGIDIKNVDAYFDIITSDDNYMYEYVCKVNQRNEYLLFVSP